MLIHEYPQADPVMRQYHYEMLLKSQYSSLQYTLANKTYHFDNDEQSFKVVQHRPKSQNGETHPDVIQAIKKGNPLSSKGNSFHSVHFCKIKIWQNNFNAFEIEQSFRVIGQSVHGISVHPTLPFFTIVVDFELQL